MGETSDLDQLRRQTALLESVLDSMGEGLVVCDTAGNFLLFNRAAERIIGIGASSGGPEQWPATYGVYYPDTVTPFPAEELPLVRAVRGEESSEVEQFLRNPKVPQGVYVSVTGRPLRDADGALVGGVALVRDVTEQKRAEAELRAREQRFRGLAESAHDAIVSIDSAGKVHYINPEAERIFGYAAAEVQGEPVARLIPDMAGRPDIERLVTMQGTGTGRVALELSGRRQDGTTFPVELSLAPWREGEARSFIAILRDATARKRIAEELRIAKEEAEAASRDKSGFLARMSHEIRTPMNGVIGMLDLLGKTGLSPQQRELADIARASAETLLRLLNDILDFSRIEAERLELESVSFHLREMVGDVMKSLSSLGHEKGLELAHHVQPDVPDTWLGDPGRLSQVLVNLIGNAIKFTARGEIVVRVEETPQPGEERRLLHFTVADTGIGIHPDKLETIFAAFSQADTSTTRQFGGTGLGLAISSRLVELMGGRLWVESEVGRGSTFHFTVRLPLYDAARPMPPSLPEVKGLSALVVDDNTVNRKILGELLASWGMRPVLAASGAEGLGELERSTMAGEPHPLIVLDYMMPDMDGVAVAERIRHTPAMAGAIILMLSSADRPVPQERCDELGIALCLIKPVKESELLEAIITALGRAGSRARTIAPAPLEGTSRPLRILVAEDNPVNQRVVQAVLQQRGHTPVLAANGREALAAWEREAFDLVLMDIQMPEMDGFQATAAIRAREASTSARLPIVALTAHALQGDRERCLAAGMDGYLAKPIRSAELIEVVESLAPLGKPAAPPATHNGAEGPPPAPTAGLAGSDVHPKGLGALFVADMARLRGEITDAIARRDGDALQRAAHSLRGSAGYFAAHRTVELAARLEELGRAGEFGADTDRAYRELCEDLARLERVLAADEE